jgi:hypothetical protein
MNSRPEAFRFLTRRGGVPLAGLAVAACALRLAGCEAFGGYPGGEVTYDASTLYAATIAGLPCLGTCLPDPGSGPVDCEASTHGVTKLTILTCDDVDSQGDFFAENLYTYGDGTVLPANVYGTPPNLLAKQSGWQPETQSVNYCGVHNNALHVVGGYLPSADSICNTYSLAQTGAPFQGSAAPFRGWGGGMGIAMQKLNNSDGQGDTQKGLCGVQPNGGPLPHPEVCPPATAEYAVRVGALDVSTFDGVSFWGRRGPNSQAGIGVNVGDKYTDDDLSYLTYRSDPAAPRHCERVKECACTNLKPCEYQDPGPLSASTCGQSPAGFYCSPPDPVGFQSISGQGSNFYCDVTECNQVYPAYPNDVYHLPDGGTVVGPTGAAAFGDQQFFNRPCTPYTRPDGYGSSFCFDPTTDPLPANPTETCGDHWMKMVDLTSDWQFFKVPFTDLRQQGFAKKSELLDLHSVSVVRFTWTAGWIDYWIDEVSFYRNSQ